MINSKKVIGIIPARSGSKGLPGKNIKEICGKPLLEWTVNVAKKSAYIDELIVSTDSIEYADLVRGLGIPIPFMRPVELADDSTSTFEVVKHVLYSYKSKLNKEFDYIILLEPTSPLREDNDVDHMLERLNESEEFNDSIVSIGEVNTHPSIIKKIADGRVVNYCPDLLQTTRRQDNDSAFFPYGVAYIAKVKNYLQEKTFYTERCLGYEIKRYQCYEIDDIFDFICVEAIMKNIWNIK